MIKKLLLIFMLALPSFARPCDYNYVDLRNIVVAMGWRVTSEMGGGHNAHSRHYIGKAIDVSVRGKNQFDIDMLTLIFNQNDLIVRDERKRPQGQRVWRGPHLHLAVPYCT